MPNLDIVTDTYIAMEYENIIEALIKYYTGSAYAEDLNLAKQDFFEISGFVDEKSDQFELRVSQFLDWYLFSRHLNDGKGLAPVKAAWIFGADEEIQKEQASLEKLVNHRHGLFEFLRLRGENTLVIYDLFSQRKIIVKKSPYTVGFDSGEIFEARLIPHEDSYVFLKGICFHPANVKNYILSEINKYRFCDRSEREALMFRLLKMRYRYDQYRHVKVDMIYTNDSVFKG